MTQETLSPAEMVQRLRAMAAEKRNCVERYEPLVQQWRYSARLLDEAADSLEEEQLREEPGQEHLPEIAPQNGSSPAWAEVEQDKGRLRELARYVHKHRGQRRKDIVKGSAIPKGSVDFQFATRRDLFRKTTDKRWYFTDDFPTDAQEELPPKKN